LTRHGASDWFPRVSPVTKATPAATVAPPNMWLLAGALAVNSMGTHLFTASLPEAGRDLDVSNATIQLTLTLSLLGVAVAEVIAGSLSDRLGRRPMMLYGAVLFVAGSAMAFLSPGAVMLIMARLFQALGSGAVRVSAIAAGRDNISAQQAARRFATLTVAQASAPMVALVLGGFVASWFGWRSVFMVSGGLVLLFFVASLLWLPETNHHRTASQSLRMFLLEFRELLRHRRFVGYTLGCGLNNGNFFGLAAAVPFVLSGRFDVAASDVGLYFTLFMVGNILGLTVGGRINIHFPAPRICAIGSAISLVGAVLLLVIFVSENLTILTLCAALTIYVFGCGFLYPSAMTGAINVDPRHIGAAAGAFSFVVQFCGAMASFLVGFWSEDPALGIVVVSLMMATAGRAALLLTR
jgi:DHA1 family bicyclomycin/chloramphenicol resistance-like MFS transporter